MGGCSKQSCGLGCFGMLQLSVCRCSSKEEHVEPSEEVTSCHQCVFPKTQVYVCKGTFPCLFCLVLGDWLKNLWINGRNELLLGTCGNLQKVGDHESWVIPRLQTGSSFIPRQWSITIKLSRILLYGLNGSFGLFYEYFDKGIIPYHHITYKYQAWVSKY